MGQTLLSFSHMNSNEKILKLTVLQSRYPSILFPFHFNYEICWLPGKLVSCSLCINSCYALTNLGLFFILSLKCQSLHIFHFLQWILLSLIEGSIFIFNRSSIQLSEAFVFLFRLYP